MSKDEEDPTSTVLCLFKVRWKLKGRRMNYEVGVLLFVNLRWRGLYV